MRRLPVYMLLDTSGSMQGEPIEAVNSGLETLISALRQDPHALETVYMTLITFDAEAKIIVPMTPLEEVVLPQFTTPRSGPTHLGLALKMLGDHVSADVIKGTDQIKGDWAPYLFVMTDGKPSDTQLYAEQCEAIRKLGFASIIGCAAGPKATEADLKPLCDHIGPVAVPFWFFESNTRHEGDRIWQRYTAMSSNVMRFASRKQAA